MIINGLKLSEAYDEMERWIAGYPNLPKVENDYNIVRIDLNKFNRIVREQFHKDYDIDIHFGMYLYTYLWSQDAFNMRVAANDDFWRYLSIKVIPDIVSERWGKDNHDHYWKRSTRIWLKQIWWFIHLTWQRDVDKTLEVIESENFTTDEIMNLVERAGRRGYYINVYRYITYFYSKVPKTTIQEFKRNSTGKNDSLFRNIMRLNTARVMVVDPGLCEGKEERYVLDLFHDLKVRVS